MASTSLIMFDFAPKILWFPFTIDTTPSGYNTSSTPKYYTGDVSHQPMVNMYFMPNEDFTPNYVINGTTIPEFRAEHNYYNGWYYDFTSTSSLNNKISMAIPTWSNDGKTVVWYATNANSQLNGSAKYIDYNTSNWCIGYRKYYWVAIG